MPTLISSIREELHARLDAILDRLLTASRSETIEDITGKLGKIAESSLKDLPDDEVPFARQGRVSRATDPNLVAEIVRMRDEDKAEWNEIVEHLKRGVARTVTGVPWSRDNVVKLYQTAKAKLRARSSGLKLQGKYMGLLRSVPTEVGKKAKVVRKSEGLTHAVRFLESERKKTGGVKKDKLKASTKVTKLHRASKKSTKEANRGSGRRKAA